MKQTKAKPSQGAIDQLALARFPNPYEAIRIACEVQRAIARKERMGNKARTVQLKTMEALK